MIERRYEIAEAGLRADAVLGEMTAEGARS
jgi:hypothetical protein